MDWISNIEQESFRLILRLLIGILGIFCLSVVGAFVRWIFLRKSMTFQQTLGISYWQNYIVGAFAVGIVLIFYKNIVEPFLIGTP
jgi:TRAP-type C4-dicarboxylate transport system permease small subunit